MAMLQDSNLSSSNHYATSASRKSSSESARRSNTQASAYAVNASTMALSGFHFSTLRAGGLGWLPARKRSGDAAYHITEECERLFCETLRSTFLVEKDAVPENSLVMDMRNTVTTRKSKTGSEAKHIQQSTILKHDLPTPSQSPDGRIWPLTRGTVRDFIEIWDYAGGASFRGFVAEKRDSQRGLFVFFDHKVIGKDLKPGLMALLELASSEALDCSQLIVCVDRTAESEHVKDTTRDLGWVGFELMMLDAWAGEQGCISDRWIFMGMDV